MKALTIDTALATNSSTISVTYLLDYLPEGCNLEIFGMVRQFVNHGRYRIILDTRLNSEWERLSCETTDMVALDQAWMETFGEEDEQTQGDAVESLIREVLVANETKLAV